MTAAKHEQSTPILYSFRRCPYAMRARMGLYSSGMTVELREVVLKDKPQHMLEISPKGTVPVLLLNNGHVLEESTDILNWALDQNDPERLKDEDQELAQRLIQQNDGSFKAALDRYKYPNRFPDEDCSTARDDGQAILQQLDENIQNNDGFLASRKLSRADIAIFPFIRQFAHVDREWFYGLPLPNLQKWLRERLESNLFKAIMPKYKQWEPAAEPVYFGRAID